MADYFAVRQLADYHRLAVDAEDAAAMALAAGLDVELPGTDCYGAPLLDAVRSGRVAPEELDTAVARVLTTKFDLGLFEQPFVDPDDAIAATNTRHTASSPARSPASRSCCCATTERCPCGPTSPSP